MAPQPRAGASGYQRLLSRPMTASFRFVGVAEQRPAAAWDPDLARPLTEDENREMDALIEVGAGR